MKKRVRFTEQVARFRDYMPAADREKFLRLIDRITADPEGAGSHLAYTADAVTRSAWEDQVMVHAANASGEPDELRFPASRRLNRSGRRWSQPGARTRSFETGQLSVGSGIKVVSGDASSGWGAWHSWGWAGGVDTAGGALM